MSLLPVRILLLLAGGYIAAAAIWAHFELKRRRKIRGNVRRYPRLNRDLDETEYSEVLLPEHWPIVIRYFLIIAAGLISCATLLP